MYSKTHSNVENEVQIINTERFMFIVYFRMIVSMKESIAVITPFKSDLRRAQQASEHSQFILLLALVNRSGGRKAQEPVE